MTGSFLNLEGVQYLRHRCAGPVGNTEHSEVRIAHIARTLQQMRARRPGHFLYFLQADVVRPSYQSRHVDQPWLSIFEKLRSARAHIELVIRNSRFIRSNPGEVSV